MTIDVGPLTNEPACISNIPSSSSVGPTISSASPTERDLFHRGNDEQAFSTENMKFTPSKEEAGQSSENRFTSAVAGCLGAEANI